MYIVRDDMHIIIIIIYKNEMFLKFNKIGIALLVEERMKERRKKKQ